MTLSTQFLTMLSMIGMGSLFGVMFDTYQRFLKRPKRKQWIVFFNDLFFWMIQALLIFYILFLVNKGEIRFYIFIALLCGFAAYQSLFKNLYLYLLELLIRTVVYAAGLLTKAFQLVIFKPVLGLIHLVIIILLSIGRGLFTLVKFVSQVILFILKILFGIVRRIWLVFWRLMPKSIKKTVEKLYNKTAGNFNKIENYFVNWINKWKKKKE